MPREMDRNTHNEFDQLFVESCLSCKFSLLVSFKLTQLIVLTLFIVFAIAAATRFRKEAAA